VENQKLGSSLPIQAGKIPAKWQERYIIKRIDEDDIEISLQERNAILQALNEGARFVQLRKYTLMLNGLKSIEPKWGEANIPPRPKKDWRYDDNADVEVINQKELDEWDSYFGS
jgi:hypothetical protein